MKKLLLLAIIVVLAIFSAACSESNKKAKKKILNIKVRVSSEQITRVWDFVAKKRKKKESTLKSCHSVTMFCQTQLLLKGNWMRTHSKPLPISIQFIKDQKLDLVPIATTLIAPMGIFSDKYKDVKDIPDGGKIAVPNDASNMGRALLLLQEAGLIGLPEDFNGLGSVDSVTENPKNLEIVPMVAAQTPRVLPDVAASVINNGVAVDAGFNPTKDSILHENETATPYVNIIAVRAEDKDNETLKKVAKLYQSEDTAKFIEEEYKGSQIQPFIPLEKIGW